MVRLAVGSLVNRYKGTTNIIYTPFNPSLSDYILVRYLNSVECCSIVFISL
ncbi:MAG: hypothetical protein LBU14_00945 [Candidatus Peribacteria bacterium]|nr:hypothetical protein [Candidatus Peribacteria bacterium]